MFMVVQYRMSSLSNDVSSTIIHLFIKLHHKIRSDIFTVQGTTLDLKFIFSSPEILLFNSDALRKLAEVPCFQTGVLSVIITRSRISMRSFFVKCVWIISLLHSI